MSDLNLQLGTPGNRSRFGTVTQARGGVFTPGLQFDGVEKRWRRLVDRNIVSDDAAFDARRTAPMKPPPRFTH